MTPSHQEGMSLIELLISMAILAILVVIGVPSYQQWVRNTRIRNASESVQNGLRLARSEAAQRSANVRFELTSTSTADWTVCVLNGAATCGGAGTSNIQTFVSSGSANNIQLDVATTPGNLGTQLTTGIPANSGVTFTALGRPSAYGTTDLARIDATSGQAGDRWLVTTISSGGMVHMCDPQLHQSVSPQGCIP